MEPLSNGGILVFVAGAQPVDRVIVHREQARSHKVRVIFVGAGLLAKNDNAVYLFGTRHKYQEATVR